MKFTRLASRIRLPLSNARRPLSLFLFLGLIALGTPAQDRILKAGELTQCFPTCTENDARFLIVPGGVGADTFRRSDIEIGFRIPVNDPSFQIGIFDADTGRTGADGRKHWDQGDVALHYDIYNDANGDGVPDGGPIFSATGADAAALDNQWYDFPVIPTTPAAQVNASADFRYLLLISNPDTNPFAWSSFKLRADSDLRISPQVFGFLAPLGTTGDVNVVYPSFPALFPRTYDGTWEFFMELPFPVSQISLWDGDFDFGASDCSTRDTDDPNTPNSLPAFVLANSAVKPEGEAVADENVADCSPGVKPSGNPPDDDFGLQGPVYRRSPSVWYEIIDPSGVNVYRNLNPSGNREFERFLISVNPADNPDWTAPTLPAGVYRVIMHGMDMGNVNVWRFPYELVAPQRRVRVGKVTGTATHPQQDFNGTIAPGGAATTFTVGLAQDTQVSTIQAYQISTASQTFTETPVPLGWNKVGYTVKPDPNGNATCSVNENYGANPLNAALPENSTNYLVCIRNDFQEANRCVRIGKVTGAAAHPQATFTGTIVPGDPDFTFSETLALDQALSPISTHTVSTAQQTITETSSPADWSLVGYTLKPDPLGVAVCAVNEAYAGGAAIVPPGHDRFLVCIRNDIRRVQNRIVRFQKVTTAPDHGGGTFAGPITPGGPDTTFSLNLAIDEHFSPIQSRSLSSSAHSATETVPAGWELKGFNVKQDPNGTETCKLTDSYSGTQGQIPAGTGQYLVCIRNEPTCPPDPTQALIQTTVNVGANTVTIRGFLSTKYSDNTYGANAIGWPSGHKWNDLVGSDNMTFELYDAGNVKKMDLQIDLISKNETKDQVPDPPSGFNTLGPFGGDGKLNTGLASDVVSFRTSIAENFNTFGCVLIVDSPPTDMTYTPHASCPNWIFPVWYEVTVKLSAFGAAGFGKAIVPEVHASPNKKPQPGACPGGGVDYCDSHGKPTHIVLEYTGGTCASSNTTQPQPNKFNCTDAGGGPGALTPVWIQGGQNNVFNQQVGLGQTFTVPTNNQSNTFVRIYTGNPAAGGVLRETLQIHTSCSAPLVPDEQFGAVKLKALSPP